MNRNNGNNGNNGNNENDENDENYIYGDNGIVWKSLYIKEKYLNDPFRIPLRNRKKIIVEYTKVSIDKYEDVIKYYWHLNHEGYAKGGESGHMLLSHFVCGKPAQGNCIDHQNRDRLDNTTQNLREMSLAYNNHNSSIDESSKKFKYRGITRFSCGKYYASCNNKYIGNYNNIIDAAIAYDKYSYIYYGESALNNKLVKYEDVKDLKLEDIIQEKTKINDLPKHIRMRHERYFAEVIYNKKSYNNGTKKTLDEAKNDLEKIYKKIEEIEKEKENCFNTQQIKRNELGIAIISIDNKLDVMVDDDKWYELSKFKWHITKAGYIRNSKLGMMHRYLMNATSDIIIDHKNGIKHDNRIDQLRPATPGENSHNRIKLVNASSKYIGVSKNGKKWHAEIKYKGEKYFLGRYENELDAAKAYNIKALELYKDKAKLNIL
jgi:hypothetical protein